MLIFGRTADLRDISSPRKRLCDAGTNDNELPSGLDRLGRVGRPFLQTTARSDLGVYSGSVLQGVAGLLR